MSDEWPKAWDDITPDTSDSSPFITNTTWVDLGPMRFYDETVYINPDAVWEGENRDVWMPLGNFLAREAVDDD